MSSGRSSVPARPTPRRRARASAAALVAAIVLSGCGANDDPGRLTLAAFGSGADAQHERGRAIYNFRCYYCHGYSGDAKTLAATFLDPPPRDFTGAPTLNRATIALTVRHGRPGTGMASFAGILDEREIEAVAAFVEQEFVKTQSLNTRYHTAANGWPDHERYADAYPFVRGEVALDTPPERLDARLRQGRKLFSTTCISCHDRARVTAQGSAWETRPLSAPRSEYAGDPDEKHDDHDEIGPYAIHDVAPKLVKASAAERRGERIYRDACQMCHAADGTGKNWIGSFLEPHPTDLTDRANTRLLDPEALARAIATGKPDTSMPAFASVLTGDEIASLGAYIRRAFGPPARSGP
ncbi:MAG: cytochrome c [Burkholderiales bacterium]